MGIERKRVMAPLNQAVRSSIVNAKTSTEGGSSDCSNSSCTSGSDHEIDAHMMFFGYDAHELQAPAEEFHTDEENEDEDDDCSGSSAIFRDKNEASVLQSFRQQLFLILQVVSAFECALLREIQRIMANANVCNEDKSRRLRYVMNALRFGGYNAGVCKVRWKQTHAYPAGSYEFLDVLVAVEGGKKFARFLVDLDFRSQFEIARPTTEYHTLMNDLPLVFVGSAEKLVKIIKLMSDSARRSLKKRELSIPPWRKYRYLHLKWLCQYKRTTNLIPSSAAASPLVSLNNFNTAASASASASSSSYSANAKLPRPSPTAGNVKKSSGLASLIRDQSKTRK